MDITINNYCKKLIGEGEKRAIVVGTLPKNKNRAWVGVCGGGSDEGRGPDP